MIKVDECDPLGELEPSFPYRDVQIRRGTDINEFYEMQTEIGRGKFGTVYRCREKSTGLQLAAKYVATPRRDDRRNVEREVDIMRKLQHPRLIQLYDAFDSSGKAVWLILELIEGGELFERVIDDDFILTEKACTIFMRQICEGIEFVHRQNILHLDMKPENILCLTKTGNRIKIIDFGLARKFDPQKKLQVLFGTPEFVAPEVVNFDQIGYGTDMWSVGVICYVLLSGLSPFMGETDVETMANVTIAKYDFDDEAFNEISANAKEFIQKLLLKDKELRMSASQCLEHAWLKRSPPPPAPPPCTITPATEELDVTKDNLRSFVERWNEHPDSPYMFDTMCNSICPLPPPSLLLSSPSQHSLRGMSPSPCGSLSSSSSQESVLDADTHLPQYLRPPDDPYYHYAFDSKGIQTPPWYIDRLLNERRASDSTCIIAKKNPGGGEMARVNLVDEIRRLSDRLFQMASRQQTPTSPPKEKDDGSIKGPSQVNQKAQQEAVTSAPLKTQTTMENNKSNSTNDVPWRKSTFLAGPLIKNTTEMTNGTSKEDISRRPKFKITALARDVPIAPPTTNKTSASAETNQKPNPTMTPTNNDSTTPPTTTTHSSRWGIPAVPPPPTYTRSFSRTSTSSTASSSSSVSPRESLASLPIRCPSSSSSSSQSAPHSPVQTPRQLSPDIKPDLTEDLLAHLLEQPKWENRVSGDSSSTTTTMTTKVFRSEERGRKGLSMEWSQVEMTMESLGQRTMKSLANYFDSPPQGNTNEKDALGHNKRQNLARNLPRMGV